MTGKDPAIGDEVSWNWGGGAPGGKVAEKKTEGEVAIKSKKGNIIKKNASKDNPAVHISRSGNDVVKRVSELNVEKKGSGGGNKRKQEDKEKEDEKDENDDKIETNDDGKDVRAGGKKQKKEAPAEKEEKEDTKAKASEEKKSSKSKATANGATKKEKKASKPRDTESVSGRTRSQKK